MISSPLCLLFSGQTTRGLDRWILLSPRWRRGISALPRRFTQIARFNSWGWTI